MGSKDAITLLNNIRDNLNEALSAADMTVSTAGNVWTNSYLLECLNKGKDREWDLIRRANQNYFQTSSTVPLSLDQATKEYTLETAVRQVVGMKCTTSGYENLKFRRKSQSTKEFQSRDAVPQGTTTGNLQDMIYDLIGLTKIKFADYPATSLTVTYDYIKVLDAYTLSGSSTNELPDETAEYREAYATWKALGKNPSDPRIKFWSEEVQRLGTVVIKSVSKRNIRESEYVEEFIP